MKKVLRQIIFILAIIALGIFIGYLITNNIPDVDVSNEIVIDETVKPDTVIIDTVSVSGIKDIKNIRKPKKQKKVQYISEKKYDEKYYSLDIKAYSILPVDSFKIRNVINFKLYYDDEIKPMIKKDLKKERKKGRIEGVIFTILSLVTIGILVDKFSK